jgi:mitotic-spindle organizing protein 1
MPLGAGLPGDAPGADRPERALDVAHEISKILDTGLDKETLAILIGLLENGVNPEALAQVVKELRREAAALKSAV